MGPLVRLRGLSARISYPGREDPHQTPWHQHLRVISDPRPPLVLAAPLHRLPDLPRRPERRHGGRRSGAGVAHPGLDRPSPRSCEPAAGEVELRVRAGGAVLIHGNLWHRGLPTLKAKRRMLILSYTPAWMRASPHSGPQPEGGLTRPLPGGGGLRGADAAGGGRVHVR